MPTKIVTANRLSDGLVVYLDRCGGWSERLADAAPAADEAALAPLLIRAAAGIATCEVIEAYAVEVAAVAGTPCPLRQRERIRSLGPTIRPDLGYQAATE